MIRHCSIRIILNFFFCITFYSCTPVPEALNNADRLMETYPDSALYILRHNTPTANTSPSNRAFFNLLFVRALDKTLLPLKPDSLLDFSIKYYATHQNTDLLALCYLYKGRMFKYGFQYDKAMEYYLKSLDEAQVSKDNLLLGRIHLDIGDIHLIQRDYGASRQKYRQSYTYFSNAGLQPQSFYSLLNIGRTYHAAKEYKSALKFYRYVLRFAKDSMQKGSALQEIAINFYDDRAFDSARTYFKQIIHFPYIENNRAVRYYYFADLLFDLNEYDSANFYAGKALSFKPDIYTQRECFRILANTAYLKGNQNNMTIFTGNYINAGDSIRKIDNQTKGYVLESMHTMNKEVVKTKNKLGSIIAFFLAVIFSGFLIYLRRKRTHSQEKLQSEKLLMKQKVNIRKEIILKHGESLLQKIDEVKFKQSSIRKKASFAEKELMDRKLYDEFLYLNDIDFFYQQMDTVLNKMVTKLRTRYPALTPKEICWCCLHLLHIPTTDIYLLLDYKVESLKKMKQRLARKIDVTGVTKIYDFLDDILSE